MKKILLSVFAALLIGSSIIIPTFSPTPVFAGTACTCKQKDGTEIPGETVDAAILKNACDCGNGESVFYILELVVDTMTIGIGILGVIGISITGIQYLTAGGSEEKTRKAKRRMFEIVIGLVAYVLIYAALKWLMPSM